MGNKYTEFQRLKKRQKAKVDSGRKGGITRGLQVTAERIERLRLEEEAERLRVEEEARLEREQLIEEHKNLSHAEQVQLLRIQGERDLYIFATQVCEFGHNPDIKGPRITEDQKELLDWLQSGHDDWLSIVLCPRDTLKSTCLQAYVLWRLVKNPNLRVLLYGEVHEQAKKRLSVIKRVIETGEMFNLCYGNLKGNIWNEDMITLNTRKHASIREANIETAGLDVVVNARHFDLVVPDDLHSERNTKTKEQIDDVRIKVELLQPLLTSGGKMIMAGVFWSDTDIHTEMMGNPDARVYLRDVLNDDGSSRYPHQLPLEELDKKKNFMRSDLFHCHYRMNPVPKDSARFKREYFIEIDRVQVKNLRIYILIDPAGDPTSETASKRDSDYFGMTVAGITSSGDIVCLDFFRERMSPTEAIEQAITFMLRYKPYVIGIEKTGIGNMGFYLKEELRKRGMFAAVIDLQPRGRSKFQRVMELEPYARTRRIFIVKDAMMKEEFYAEIVRFPKAKHDDICDSFAYVLDLITDYGKSVEDDNPDEIAHNLRELNPISQSYWHDFHKAEKKDNKNWIEDFI